ncbi:MAG TPA: hypothetical protein DFS52_23720, partial [Myxococcales bacterium]|nr:hypothetical protein [Myxococcales bacterium]
MRRSLFALSIALALVATSAAAEPCPCPCPEDQALLAGATAVAAAHRRADLLAEKDPRAAAAELRAALGLELPRHESSRMLRADLHARLAELLLKAGAAPGSLKAARAGLAEEQGLKPTALTAMLRLREGEALEATGEDDAAMAAYEEVIALGK